MHWARFFKIVTVASWLWGGQGNLAQSGQVTSNGNDNTCQIDRFTAGELLPVSDPPTALTGEFSIAISCKGNAHGNLLLTLNSLTVYNGVAEMQFVVKSGILAGVSTSPSANTITIPVNSQGNGVGNGQGRVNILAPSGSLLRAANDYKLVVTASFN